MNGKMRSIILLGLIAALAAGAERPVDPTFLRGSLGSAIEKKSDVTTASAHYKPLFEAGGIVRGVARFSEIQVDPGGASATVNYPREEQIYLVLEGTGAAVYENEKVPLKRYDFLYLPPGVPHGLANSTRDPLRVLVIGYRIPADMAIQKPAGPQIANINDVKQQVVGNHPPSTLYRLLLGDTKSKRDRIAAGHVVTSLFVMDMAPGGTNFPHHHDTEEEIYLILDGSGEMVAGGGTDGVEGKHQAKAGDAYFLRLNATVGFYNTASKPAQVLAVRSLYPFRQR